MQTLKTAAIVVLLMTIIYGAYVSLTTPPEPLPPEVESMLVMSEEEDFSIDAGLPASLGSLDVGDQPDSSAAPGAGLASMEMPSMDTAESISSASGQPDLGDTVASDMAVTGTLSDVSSSISGGIPDSQSSIAAEAVAAVQPKYPTTGKEFSLPDMNDLGVNFRTASSVKPSLPAIDGQPIEVASAPAVEARTPSITASAGNSDISVSNAVRTADQQYSQDKLKEALATLSLFYNSPNLSGEQRSDLLVRLDPLAREVIYSRRHLLEQPYRVGQNETLMQVAQRYEVPWQLLANINQIRDPVTILPGTELKVVRGPFRAEVDLVQKELTLFLDDLYAGRFPIGLGTDPAPKPGTFTIQDKQKARTFYDRSGSPIAPSSPDNPYGNMWLDLGGQLCIHGSPSTTSPTEKGCISLAADYAEDLYGILSQGSSVTIRR